MELGVSEAILGFGFTGVSTLVGWCISEVRGLRKEVVKIMEKEKAEFIIAQRRIDVHDSVASDLAEFKFNSRHIVEQGHNIPRPHESLRRIIHGESR